MKEKGPFLPHTCAAPRYCHTVPAYTRWLSLVYPRSLLRPQSCSMWHVVTFISLSKCKFGLYTLTL